MIVQLQIQMRNSSPVILGYVEVPSWETDIDVTLRKISERFRVVHPTGNLAAYWEFLEKNGIRRIERPFMTFDVPI